MLTKLPAKMLLPLAAASLKLEQNKQHKQSYIDKRYTKHKTLNTTPTDRKLQRILSSLERKGGSTLCTKCAREKVDHQQDETVRNTCNEEHRLHSSEGGRSLMILTKLRARILPAAAAVEALNARRVEQDNQKKESYDKSYYTNPLKLPARILQAAAEASNALKKSRTSSRKKAVLTEATTQI
ncbi:unnamed protein product [Sphagnum troendelagicum]|uniref:Uncharacterized protein n=1 Tax=Sphagnum troendelagicum TaxID=128251 RepID=A0ABP0TRV0_9BRYO